MPIFSLLLWRPNSLLPFFDKARVCMQIAIAGHGMPVNCGWALQGQRHAHHRNLEVVLGKARPLVKKIALTGNDVHKVDRGPGTSTSTVAPSAAREEL